MESSLCLKANELVTLPKSPPVLVYIDCTLLTG